MVYVGVDLHRKSSHVRAHRRRGAARELSDRQPAGRVPSGLRRTRGRTHRCRLRSHLRVRLVRRPAFRRRHPLPHGPHPLATKAISSGGVKNYKVDAKTLAHLSAGTCSPRPGRPRDRKSTLLNSSHVKISYAVFCLKKKKKTKI